MEGVSSWDDGPVGRTVGLVVPKLKPPPPPPRTPRIVPPKVVPRRKVSEARDEEVVELSVDVGGSSEDMDVADVDVEVEEVDEGVHRSPSELLKALGPTPVAAYI